MVFFMGNIMGEKKVPDGAPSRARVQKRDMAIFYLNSIGFMVDISRTSFHGAYKNRKPEVL